METVTTCSNWEMQSVIVDGYWRFLVGVKGVARWIDHVPIVLPRSCLKLREDIVKRARSTEPRRTLKKAEEAS